jgi:hypothetical protein
MKNIGVSPTRHAKIDPKRARYLLFPTIKDAIVKKGFGTIFTTPDSDRIYVITHGTWGKKSGNKVVKGFPADTPASEIQNYSKRTVAKHGGGFTSSFDKKDKEKKERFGYATPEKKDKVKNFKPV